MLSPLVVDINIVYCYSYLYSYCSWMSLYSSVYTGLSIPETTLFLLLISYSRTVSQRAAWGRSVGRPSQLMHRPEVINVILRPNVSHRCRHWPAKTNNTYVPWGSSRDSLEKAEPDMKSVKRQVFIFTLWNLTQKNYGNELRNLHLL